MFLTIFFQLFTLSFPLTKSYEYSRSDSNGFLKSNQIYRNKYEEFKEITETKRESCLDEYRQQQKFYRRRHFLSPLCAQYCSETNDCLQNNEPSACTNPSWPERTLKYVQKIERMCYVRFTEILQYEQAKQMCERYGLEMAIIDNVPLFERLHQLQMFNTTCRGLCPRAKGYYIGLKRFSDESNQTKWIWSNNVTWTQTETSCDNFSYPNANSLCYFDKDKKITIWNKGEPNNYQEREECVEILATTDRRSSVDHIGKLNDIPCTKPTLGVICQGRDTKPTNSTRFQYFATIVGLNETNPLSQFEGQGRPFDFDSMNSLIESLEALLSLPSFTTEQAITILNLVDQLVNVSGQIDIEQSKLKSITNKLLHFLDLFPRKILIENASNISFQYENLQMLITDMNINENQTSWLRLNKNIDVIIEINLEYFEKTHHRIIETIFSNFNLFPQKTRKQIGIPIAYQIGNRTHSQPKTDLIRYQIRIDQKQTSNLSCVHWSFDIENGSWISDDTCRFVGYRDDYAQCYCNHLTHFALLFLAESDEGFEGLSTAEEYILTFVTYLGICLSIVGLILTMITYALFRHAQRNHLHGALIMLCMSIFIVNCLYIPFNLIKSTVLCLLIGYLFHYFILCSFMWMLIIGIVQYIHFVRIFNTHISYFFFKTCLIGWVIPFIFPTLVVLFGSTRGYIGESRCWINNTSLLYLTFLIPILLIVSCNCILFGLIVQSIFLRKTVVVRYQKNHAKLQIGATFCCFVSIGCTWLFGLIVVFQPSFIHQLIFCLANSFQGFFIFLFHVYLSRPKREFWQLFFTKHQAKKSSQVELPTVSQLPRLTTFRFTTSRTSSTTTTDHIKSNSYA